MKYRTGLNVLAILCSITTLAVLASDAVPPPLPFHPISGSATSTTDAHILQSSPWIVPQGYVQTIISDESRLDIYRNGADWPDMNTTNESGYQAGRFLYRSHEVRPRRQKNRFSGGAISVIDLKSGVAKILAQRSHWEALDGLLWTPWHTLLVAEEVKNAELPDPAHPQARAGLVYEVYLKPNQPTVVDHIQVRPLLGSLAHEGIEIDTAGNVYVVDEDYYGSIYKFVPDRYGRLETGQLHVLRLDNSNDDRTGPAQWIKLDMVTAAKDAQQAARQVKATTWCRPEDLERIDQTLYVALTCSRNNIRGERRENRVLSITLDGKPVVRNFVKAGLNVPLETKGITGFARPDNLASDGSGRLWIVEDNKPSDIWVATPDSNGDGLADSVSLFASLQDPDAEGTGIYFGANPGTLFVNVQHSITGNDKTMTIAPR